MSSIKKAGKKISRVIGNTKIGNEIENKIIHKEKSFNKPPIFIIGLPRTGSTLLYQIMCNNFELSFFSNLSNVFYSSPATVAYLTRPFVKDYSIKNFESNYGVTNGLLAPSEAGGIYRYWFGEGAALNSRIPNTINTIAEILQKPFIWKNLNLSFELSKIQKLFPNVFFINMKRELPFVIQSIYLKTVNDIGINIDGLTKSELTKQSDLLEYLTIEVVQREKLVSEFLEISKILHIDIEYSKLCKAPSAELNKIKAKYSQTGFNLTETSNYRKKSFQLSNEIKMGRTKWEKMNRIIKKEKAS